MRHMPVSSTYNGGQNSKCPPTEYGRTPSPLPRKLDCTLRSRRHVDMESRSQALTVCLLAVEGFNSPVYFKCPMLCPSVSGIREDMWFLEKCVREGENDCCPGNERLVHLLGPLVALRCLLCSHCLENLLGPGCDVLRRTCNDLMMDNIWGPTD
jgi:hypothetical protein